jgi:hypothetical protein
LAEFFEKGYTGEPDLGEAFTWYSLAKPPLGTNPVIESALGIIKSQMTKEQFAKADKRVATYRKQFGIIDKSLIKDESLIGQQPAKQPQ